MRISMSLCLLRSDHLSDGTRNRSHVHDQPRLPSRAGELIINGNTQWLYASLIKIVEEPGPFYKLLRAC